MLTLRVAQLDVRRTNPIQETHMDNNVGKIMEAFTELGKSSIRGKVVDIIPTTPTGYNAMYECYLQGMIKPILNHVFPRSDKEGLHQTGWTASDHDLIEGILINFMMSKEDGNRTSLMSSLMKAGRGHWNPKNMELLIDTLTNELDSSLPKNRLTNLEGNKYDTFTL